MLALPPAGQLNQAIIRGHLRTWIDDDSKKLFEVELDGNGKIRHWNPIPTRGELDYLIELEKSFDAITYKSFYGQ